MAHHVLSLEIPLVYNKCILRVEDTSIYDPLLPVDCLTLQITPPGFVDISALTFTPNYIANITACDLGIQITNCDNYNNDLQDGVYVIRQSLAPVETVFVEYNHLRITAALNDYQKALCCIQKSIPSAPSHEVTAKIREAQFVRTLLDAAKAEVEYCHHPNNGMATYKYARERLKKLLCNCGCCN